MENRLEEFQTMLSEYNNLRREIQGLKSIKGDLIKNQKKFENDLENVVTTFLNLRKQFELKFNIKDEAVKCVWKNLLFPKFEDHVLAGQDTYSVFEAFNISRSTKLKRNCQIADESGLNNFDINVDEQKHIITKYLAVGKKSGNVLAVCDDNFFRFYEINGKKIVKQKINSSEFGECYGAVCWDLDSKGCRSVEGFAILTERNCLSIFDSSSFAQIEYEDIKIINNALGKQAEKKLFSGGFIMNEKFIFPKDYSQKANLLYANGCFVLFSPRLQTDKILVVNPDAELRKSLLSSTLLEGFKAYNDVLGIFAVRENISFITHIVFLQDQQRYVARPTYFRNQKMFEISVERGIIIQFNQNFFIIQMNAKLGLDIFQPHQWAINKIPKKLQTHIDLIKDLQVKFISAHSEYFVAVGKKIKKEMLFLLLFTFGEQNENSSDCLLLEIPNTNQSKLNNCVGLDFAHQRIFFIDFECNIYFLHIPILKKSLSLFQ